MLKFNLNISFVFLLLFGSFILCDKINENVGDLYKKNKIIKDYYDDEDELADLDEALTDPTNSVIDYQIGGFSVGGGGGLVGLQELRRREFAEEILFYILKNGKLIYTANGTSGESMQTIGCDVNDNFTVIIHGWREQADTEWIPILVSNFSKFRGGCIVIVDYGFYALGPYLRLVQRFDQIKTIVYGKMALWQRTGLNPSNVHMFGFSYGARLAVEVGRKFGPNVIKSIDVCDMAGPGFDMKYRNSDFKNSAQNVQCIHTSRDKGTRYYTNCHQNWRIGNCGLSQPGASDPPYGSHGLCPYYYNLAFTNDFIAHKMPNMCSARNPARHWPESFKMGYMESRKSEVIGELFAPVSSQPPYAVDFGKGELDEDVIKYGILPNESVDRFRGFKRRRPFMNRLKKFQRNLIDRRRRFTQAFLLF